MLYKHPKKLYRLASRTILLLVIGYGVNQLLLSLRYFLIHLFDMAWVPCSEGRIFVMRKAIYKIHWFHIIVFAKALALPSRCLSFYRDDYRYLHIDTTPLLGPFSNFEYQIHFCSRTSHKILKRTFTINYVFIRLNSNWMSIASKKF